RPVIDVLRHLRCDLARKVRTDAGNQCSADHGPGLNRVRSVSPIESRSLAFISPPHLFATYTTGKARLIQLNPRGKLSSQSSGSPAVREERDGYLAALPRRKEATRAPVAVSLPACHATCVATDPSMKFDNVYPA